MIICTYNVNCLHVHVHTCACVRTRGSGALLVITTVDCIHAYNVLIWLTVRMESIEWFHCQLGINPLASNDHCTGWYYTTSKCRMTSTLVASSRS